MRFSGIVAGFALALLSAAPAHAVVITATNSTEGVFDSDPLSAPSSSGTRTHSFTALDLMGGLNVITDVNITIDFMKCDDDPRSIPPVILTTPLPADCPAGPGGAAFANEIIFRLTSPGGIEVSLVEADPIATYSGSDAGARIVVKFDDQAAELVGSTGFESGTFFPGEPLSQFNGEGVIGTWTLYVEDSGAGDPLGFASFTLDITLADPAQAPAPGTLLLLGIGAAALFGRRRPSR